MSYPWKPWFWVGLIRKINDAPKNHHQIFRLPLVKYRFPLWKYPNFWPQQYFKTSKAHLKQFPNQIYFVKHIRHGNWYNPLPCPDKSRMDTPFNTVLNLSLIFTWLFNLFRLKISTVYVKYVSNDTWDTIYRRFDPSLTVSCLLVLASAWRTRFVKTCSSEIGR